MSISRNEIRDHLAAAVRGVTFDDGLDTVYGVCTLGPDMVASSNKVFETRERATQRLRELSGSSLYDPDHHAVVFYVGNAPPAPNAQPDLSSDGGVSPGLELDIIEMWPVGTPVTASSRE